MSHLVSKTIQISKNLEKVLAQKAPEVLEIYQNYLELLEDIEIKD